MFLLMVLSRDLPLPQLLVGLLVSLCSLFLFVLLTLLLPESRHLHPRVHISLATDRKSVV